MFKISNLATQLYFVNSDIKYVQKQYIFQFGCLEVVFSRRVKYLVSIIMNWKYIKFIIAIFSLSLKKTLGLSYHHSTISVPPKNQQHTQKTLGCVWL